jgi:hypothetical protein
MNCLLVDKNDVVLISDTAKVPAAKNGSRQRIIRTFSCPDRRPTSDERWGNQKENDQQVLVARDGTPSKSSLDRSSSFSPTSAKHMDSPSFLVAPKNTSILKNKRNYTKKESEKSKSARKTNLDNSDASVKTVQRNVVSETKSRDSPTNLSKQLHSEEQLKGQSIVNLIKALSLKAAMTIIQTQKKASSATTAEMQIRFVRVTKCGISSYRKVDS